MNDPTMLDLPIDFNAAMLGSELANHHEAAIKKALDYYFGLQDIVQPWDETTIEALGKLVHVYDGSIEFWMGETKLITFSPLEMSVEIICGAPQAMFSSATEEHYE